jgi:hypothetical protein
MESNQLSVVVRRLSRLRQQHGARLKVRERLHRTTAVNLRGWSDSAKVPGSGAKVDGADRSASRRQCAVCVTTRVTTYVTTRVTTYVTTRGVFRRSTAVRTTRSRRWSDLGPPRARAGRHGERLGVTREQRRRAGGPGWGGRTRSGRP